MAASAHGRKYSCYGCGCKFYDLNRRKVVCPRCGADPSKAPARPNIAEIAAKVLAAVVTDAEEPSDEPVADEMGVFDSDDFGDGEGRAKPGGGSAEGGTGRGSPRGYEDDF